MNVAPSQNSYSNTADYQSQIPQATSPRAFPCTPLSDLKDSNNTYQKHKLPVPKLRSVGGIDISYHTCFPHLINPGDNVEDNHFDFAALSRVIN